jgi:hypothetical protein
MTDRHEFPARYVGVIGVGDNDSKVVLAAEGETAHRALPLPVALAHLESGSGDVAVCPNAADLARRVAILEGGDGKRARSSLLALAREGRLVCLATASHLIEDACSSEAISSAPGHRLRPLPRTRWPAWVGQGSKT